MSKNRKPLSAGQRQIMEIIWEHGEVSVFEVREILSVTRETARSTVRTMMERMESKGWIKHRVIGRTHFYSPLVDRDVGLGQRVLEIMDQSCGGDPERLMNALIEYRGLSVDEIGRIQTMLDAVTPKKPKKKRSKQ